MTHIKLILVAAMLALPGPYAEPGVCDTYEYRDPAKADADGEWSEVDVIDRTVRLAPGARVLVSRIYGPVDVETVDGETAEIHVVRSARQREDLATRPIFVEASASELSVRGERDTSQGPARVRHRVTLRLPTRVELSVELVNARVNIGEVEGPVEVRRVNGTVVIAGASGRLMASRINGSLSASVARPAGSGIELTTVNGSVELRLADAANLDVRVDEFAGGVEVNLPEASILASKPREVFRARVGTGGVPVSISDVNGSIRLRPAG